MRYLVLTLALIGCTQEQPKPQAKQREQATVEPQRTHQVGSNQIIAIQVPGEAWHETQKCYVFRDLEFKTSSISCPAGATGQIEPD